MLFGKGAPTPGRSRWTGIVCGLEGLPLAKQWGTVDALSQTLKVSLRDATRPEVLAPPVDHLDHTDDFGCGLDWCVAEELAL